MKEPGLLQKADVRRIRVCDEKEGNKQFSMSTVHGGRNNELKTVSSRGLGCLRRLPGLRVIDSSAF